MVSSGIDFAAARGHMVDSQIRPNRVTHARLIAAMRSVPREAFLPAALAASAYADGDVKLGGGRVLMEPRVLARLLQAAEPRPGERALVVAAGAGYGAALLAACGVAVTALEDDAALRAMAPATPGVSFVNGAPAAGWPSGAPYDIILIEGAVAEVPEALGAQLAEGTGRLVAVRRGGAVSQAVLGEVFGGVLSLAILFDCATPLLPAFRRAPGFVF
jgi:protein-L-isoaspartate(D-aspartate) O-methyltransferase